MLQPVKATKNTILKNQHRHKQIMADKERYKKINQKLKKIKN
jgi:hypothetical protein